MSIQIKELEQLMIWVMKRTSVGASILTVAGIAFYNLGILNVGSIFLAGICLLLGMCLVCWIILDNAVKERKKQEAK